MNRIDSLKASALHWAVPRRSDSGTSSVRVVLFSGGRGSGTLTKQLVKDPRIDLTIAINGYDDGASTGEVRRFLKDSLGPSDFRKNASRMALELGTCPPALVELLDSRLPGESSKDEAPAMLRDRIRGAPRPAERLEAFIRELELTGRSFTFDDCSVGNLVFAGSYLLCGRRFNDAVDDYCGLVGLPLGAIENVTDGSNAFLVAIGEDNTILGSEEEIVGTAGRNRIRDIYLIDQPLSRTDREQISRAKPEDAVRLFEGRRARIGLNPRLAARLSDAHLIIYAPGTQHSSLFPSYLTPGLGTAISRNLGAIKLLITNIQTDAEIEGSSAVDIINRALYYLNENGARALPPPCLITHYVVNDPVHVEPSAPYVPLGQIESLEDPRLVRIANYEEGVSGRHNAAKILGPFIQSLADKPETQRLAVLLHDAGTVNKVTQTLLEMVRGSVADLRLVVTVFYEGEPLDKVLLDSLPFGVRAVPSALAFTEAIQGDVFDYVMLFESSGMYRGEDIVVLASHLASGRLDSVWGSRRLSVRDIEESLRLRYQKTPLLGAISATGSHLLSLACLLLYGRYIFDTLSGVRAIRTGDAVALDVPLTHKRANQYLLARLLRRKGEILEIPVRFFPISPERVKRTSVFEGLQSLAALVSGRFARPSSSSAVKPTAPAPGASEMAGERSSTPVGSR
jgi:2-phospho-L-lactate transferase/gluconeogenesis factor (CofD/UPF0052 family)